MCLCARDRVLCACVSNSVCVCASVGESAFGVSLVGDSSRACTSSVTETAGSSSAFRARVRGAARGKRPGEGMKGVAAVQQQ